MKFISTRGNDNVNNAGKAIVQGLANDGGLFVPENFTSVKEDLAKMLDMNYAEMASFIIGKFLDDYKKTDLLEFCEKAYSRFDDCDPAPVVKLDDGFYIMELFHGPTLAFKDVALTLLPSLLRSGADAENISDEILILVATSGDTGKAALSGFQDQKGIKIMVLYPSEGVSDMQKLQMCSQEGSNVNVVGIKGNFDDCQNTVKQIFSSDDANLTLKKKGVMLSSANSINFGRLVPQITYYFSSYIDLVNSSQIKLGDKINFVVPTGNFGDILAGYYAKRMGLPIDKLVCASNSNNVLTEFFANGTYDKNREFYKTTSPSMDILISSNLERLIFELYDRNSKETKEKMDQLKQNGKYEISSTAFENLEKDFFAGYADEEECAQTIANVFDEYGYVIDPHTAVAVKVMEEFRQFTDNKLPTVVLSTASPYKFPQSILSAITGKKVGDAFKASFELEKETAAPIPEQILSLKNKEKRFTKVIDKNDAFNEVLKFIEK